MPAKDRNEEYVEQLDIIRTSKRPGEENSPHFNQMNQRLSALNKAMNEMSAEGYQMSSADISSLRVLYAEAGAAVKAYLEHLPTWVPRRWRSPEGLARQAGARRLQELMQQDMAALDRYNPKDPMRLTDFLRDARNLFVNEPAQMEKLSGQLSTREVIEQNGQKGVFTENAPVTSKGRIFEDVVARRSARLGPQDAERPVMDAVLRLNREHKTIRNFVKSLRPGTLQNLGTRFKENNFAYLDEDIHETIELLKEKLQRENYPYKIIMTDRDARTATPGDRAFNRMIGELLEESSRLKGSSGNLNAMGVEKGRSIGDRNTAMSIVGDLIYCPDILARSTDMKMRLRNGNEIQGTYMEWSEGNDIQELSSCVPDDPEERKDLTFDFDSPKIIKDVGDILALDYICGNTDRHLGNLHVTFRKDPADGIYKYKGLQGIDNDESFPIFGPKDMAKDKNGGDGSHVNLPEDIAAMKESTARSILNLTKETLTFALRHKLTEKEINSAWERTQYLQNHIRKGLAYNWKSDDEILPGQIHVIPDNSRAWDGMNLSAVAHATPHDSFYQTLNTEFEMKAKPNIAQARDQAVERLERPGLVAERRILRDRKDPSVTGNPNWLNDQVAAKKEGNRKRLEDAAARRKQVEKDGPLKPILNQSLIELDYFGREGQGRLYQHAEDMYNVYHSRRNLTYRLAENAAKVLRKIEKDQMSHLFAPGYKDHSAVRAAGMGNPNGRYFIDGEPAEQYARRKYWSRSVAAEYATLKNDRDREKYMETFVSAHILAAMTSGRHHVDVAVLAQSEQGPLQIRLFEAKMNLFAADWNGRQARIDSISGKVKDRKTRQDAIRASVKEKLMAKFNDGSLNAYRDTILRLKQDAADRIYRPDAQQPQAVPGQNPQQPQAVPGQNPQQIPENQVNVNPHRLEQIRPEVLEEPRPRSNSFNLGHHPGRNDPQINQDAPQVDQNDQAGPGLRAKSRVHR